MLEHVGTEPLPRGSGGRHPARTQADRAAARSPYHRPQPRPAAHERLDRESASSRAATRPTLAGPDGDLSSRTASFSVLDVENLRLHYAKTLYSGTVSENIRYGSLDATDDQIIAAAKAVGADEFITSLDAGYETKVGEGGAILSGGQRQLISFARALLANPEF